ncbi:MAG: DUF1700 domain-containing protein [Christensenellaceae bacterium]|nr:DUF1700 domain-containing protein [Christensenellaceae bacterium]
MNKHEFLSILRDRLSGLPKEDIERSLDYYSEIIDDHIEDGLTEEEAVKKVGSIDEIISQIFMETPLTRIVNAKVKQKRSLRAWEIILLILGSPVWLPLVISAAVIVLSIYIVLWSIIVSLYGVVISIAATAVSGIFGGFALLIAGNSASGALLMGIGLICVGAAILLLLGFNRIAKGIFLLGKKLLFGIKNCFVRKGRVK